MLRTQNFIKYEYMLYSLLISLQLNCKDKNTPIIKRLTINYAQRAKELKHKQNMNGNQKAM